MSLERSLFSQAKYYIHEALLPVDAAVWRTSDGTSDKINIDWPVFYDLLPDYCYVWSGDTRLYSIKKKGKRIGLRELDVKSKLTHHHVIDDEVYYTTAMTNHLINELYKILMVGKQCYEQGSFQALYNHISS